MADSSTEMMRYAVNAAGIVRPPPKIQFENPIRKHFSLMSYSRNSQLKDMINPKIQFVLISLRAVLLSFYYFHIEVMPMFCPSDPD